MSLIPQKLYKIKSRGDTIVEVLVVVTVLALVIGTSYAIATRSQRANRQTEERTQAVKVAESQIEAIRNYPQAIANNARFCISNGTLVTLPSTVQNANIANEPFNDYPAACRQIPDGGSCNTYCYFISVRKTTGDNYTVMVRWDGVNGRRDQVVMYYRIGAPA